MLRAEHCFRGPSVKPNPGACRNPLAGEGDAGYECPMKFPSFWVPGLLLVVISAASGWAAPAPAPAVPAAPLPKIEGVEVPRNGGGYLGVTIVDGTFRISFYDARKRPVPADVSRALLRWDPKYKQGQERVILNASADGRTLGSARAIRPPYLFRLFITLLKDAGGSDEAGEGYVIDFKA